jgi:hypothetical protein
MDLKNVGITDEPLGKADKDDLDIARHAQALTSFIRTTSTPITIGIQGEWGSGKTSLLNTIYSSLEESGKYKQIWINSWEHSLLCSPEETLIKILGELVENIISVENDERRKQQVKNIASTVFKGVVRIGAAATLGNKAGDVADELLGESTNAIKRLRDQLNSISTEVTSRSTNPFDKIVVYVDDLDRIEPRDAIKILELLKNIFSVPGCVFILAIDYQVVVKGLKDKFGERTPENEWEFRAFFDKLIQLPFMMPVGQYNISKYVNSLFRKIGFIDDQDLDPTAVNEIIVRTIGGNPRSLKRLVNSMALINIFVTIDEKYEDSGEVKNACDPTDQITIEDKKLLFLCLLCTQIAYPDIYNLLVRNPDFPTWNDSFAFDITQGRETSSKEEFEQFYSNATASGNDFDEDWECALLRICYPNPRYRSRVYDISKFLSYIKDDLLKNRGDELGEMMTTVINNTAVTSVAATDDYQHLVRKSKRKVGLFGARVDGMLFEGKSLPVLSEQVLRHLVDSGVLSKINLPWGVSKSRIVLSNDETPKHPSGRPFFKPVSYGGYTLECHYDRDRGLGNLRRLCDDIGIDFGTN